MEEKSKINNLHVYQIPEKTSIQKEPIMEGKLTGYPSIDKPWLGKYPKQLFSIRKKYNTISDRLKDIWKDKNQVIINYYGKDIKVEEFFTKVEEVAKSLYSMGIKEGDSIMASLESVPEFLELLLASELIGCSIKNYIGNINEIVQLINDNDDGSIDYYFTHDYLTQEQSTKIYSLTNVKNVITIDPLFSAANVENIRKNILDEINSRYVDETTSDERNISWSEFLNFGKLKDEIVISNNPKNKLFCAYTSGTTGQPKEVMHSSESMIGIIDQLALFPSHEKTQDSWLLTILPPTLVAVVVAMMCYPICDGKKLILDPYCKLEDLDLEMMYYEPNCWGLIPIFFDTLLESKRIPEGYDMSYFKLFGFGAEPLTKKSLDKIQKFLDQHNCKAPFSSGYGQSEGGSDFTVAIGREMLASGTAGMPLIDTIISVFEPNSDIELKYNQIGEICKTGPGIMLGYSSKEQTDKVLKHHSDGNLWLHTGDYGFMTEQGLLFVLGREGIKVYPDKMVFGLNVENQILEIDGIKEAIIVSGKDKENDGYEVPYLFVVPEKNVNVEELTIKISALINNQLSEESKPKDVFFIDAKPINKFKTDRKILQKTYNLI